jgi:hypothetical protein
MSSRINADDWVKRTAELVVAIQDPAEALTGVKVSMPKQLPLVDVLHLLGQLGAEEHEPAPDPPAAWATAVVDRLTSSARELRAGLHSVVGTLRTQVGKRLEAGQRDERVIAASDFGEGLQVVRPQDVDGKPLGQALALGRRSALPADHFPHGLLGPGEWLQADGGECVVLGPAVQRLDGGHTARPWYLTEQAVELTRSRAAEQREHERRRQEADRHRDEQQRLAAEADPVVKIARLEAEIQRLKGA